MENQNVSMQKDQKIKNQSGGNVIKIIKFIGATMILLYLMVVIDNLLISLGSVLMSSSSSGLFFTGMFFEKLAPLISLGLFIYFLINGYKSIFKKL